MAYYYGTSSPFLSLALIRIQRGTTPEYYNSILDTLKTERLELQNKLKELDEVERRINKMWQETKLNK